MDPIFEHLVVDSARERVKCVIRQLEKSQEIFEKLLHTCFKCGGNNVFSIAKQVRLQRREHLYSTTVVIVAINGVMDDNVK